MPRCRLHVRYGGIPRARSGTAWRTVLWVVSHVRHAKLVARNRAVLASLQATCSTRVFRTVPPQELTNAAHKAARLTDTDAHIQTASRAYTRPLWYQSRVWDPDD